MPTVFVPFAGLDPSAEHGSGLIRCENVLPAWGGLRSIPKATNSGGSPTAPGGQTFHGFLSPSYIHIFPETVGVQLLPDNPTEYYSARQTVAPSTDAIAVYVYQAGVWTHLNTYTSVTSLTGAFRFASFGNDIWAVCPTAVPQRRTNNAGAFAAGVSSATVPLNPRFIAPVRTFMVITDYLDQYWWSDSNDATYYSVADATRPSSLAGSGLVRSRPGGFTGFIGGEYGIFWKRNSMHALQFTGGSDVWRLDEISVGVGTPAPSSIVTCRDGARRFWGGDGFYEQSGLGEPQKITGSDDITALLLDGAFSAANNELNLEDVYARLWHEDGFIVGFEEPEMNGVFWFYQAGSTAWAEAAALPALTAGVYFDLRSRRWTTVSLSEGILAASTIRSYTSDSAIPLRFLAGTFAPTGGGTHQRFTFQSTTHYAVTLTTQRFAIDQEEAENKAQRVKLRGVMPVVTLNEATFSTDYRLATLPADLAVRVVTSNDPHFQQSPASGTVVNPRSESYTIAKANDHGWLPHKLEGRWWLIEVSLPESASVLRGLRGVWLDYEVVP